MIHAGEKIDIHIMKDAPAGEWQLLSTEVTDKNGRVSYTIPSEKAFGYGIYPIKMVVRQVTFLILTQYFGVARRFSKLTIHFCFQR